MAGGRNKIKTISSNNSFNHYRVENARKSNSKRFPNGCLYIIGIEGTDYYKIGVSQNVDRRLRDLESSTPFTLNLLYCEYYLNVYDIESHMHQMLKDFYVKSEWFDIDIDVIISIISGLQNKKIDNINQSPIQIKIF